MSNENVNGPDDGGSLFSNVLFNIERHDLITQAAYPLLNANAKAKVDELLAAGQTAVQTWGGWADRIKDADEPPVDAETTSFLQNNANKSHKKWHYVNLPLNSAGYQGAAEFGFTRDNDVVQTIRTCVLVLKGQSNRFSEVNALRLLGHFVGDIHQPLHTGCGFFDDSTTPPTLLKNPKVIRDKGLQDNSDTGGNDIKLPGASNFHSFWDGGGLSGNLDTINLSSASDAKTKRQLIKRIYEGAKKLGSAGGAGLSGGGAGLSAVSHSEDWAIEWAGEALKAARKAYRNFRVVSKSGGKYTCEWKTTKADYIATFRPIVLKQLKLGARNLADLLNDIYP